MAYEDRLAKAMIAAELECAKLKFMASEVLSIAEKMHGDELNAADTSAARISEICRGMLMEAGYATNR